LYVVERKSAVGLTTLQTRARHILLKTSATLSPAAARAQLLSYKQQIDRGQATFDQMARLHSQDGSAEQGGDLGWATPGQFVSEFEQVMNELRPGQVSDPVISRFGVHLIQVVERREIPLTPVQEREYARNMLRESKFDETLDTWAREVRGQAYIEYREPPQ
jgi:peptidyl-prolyl cis-trans isomerase SurA